MTQTLQEQFEKDFPDKSVREINAHCKYWDSNFTNYDLDLREYRNLEKLGLGNGLGNKGITSLNINGLTNLTKIDLGNNNLTSVDFLNQLPNPKKLEWLEIYSNNIQPTDIAVFSKFVNLESLQIGTIGDVWGFGLQGSKHNKFYGSLKSCQNMNKLEKICIAATDVDSGLEFLPMSLVKRIKDKEWYWLSIQCSPHGTDAKCSKIQDQLRKYDYDLSAWQLAHPHRMYNARPEIFFDPKIKNEWLSALRDKTNQTQEKLEKCKATNKSEDVKRIKRLEMKLENLKLIQQNISKDNFIDRLQAKELVKKEDKSTQTDLITEKTEQLNQIETLK